MQTKALLVAAVALGLLFVSVPSVGASVTRVSASHELAVAAAVAPTAVVPAANISSWSLLGTQSPPRDGHGWVYDSRMDRFIVFGGVTSMSTVTNSTWLYDYANNTWTNVTPVVSPSPRAAPNMAYDSDTGRVVLFGGSTSPGVADNETWFFTPQTDTWTKVAPGIVPPARFGAAMAYDAGAHVTVLFGGANATGPIGGTWAYNYSLNEWLPLNATGPVPLYLAQMVYDASAGRDILFGGVSFVGLTVIWHFDTWSLDARTDTWTNLNPVRHPTPRAGMGFAYDSLVERSIMFGGTNSLGGPGTGGTFNDTWAYSYAQNDWTNVTPGGASPAPRLLTAMAFSPVANRTVLFGGASLNGTPFNDTWAFRYAAGMPGAPRNLVASAAAGRVTLTWQAPLDDGGSPITNYTIYRGTTSAGETLLTTVGKVLTYDDNAVNPGTTYYYEVAAVTAVGEGQRSNEASATPLITPAPPTAPRNLAAAAGDTQVVLTWQAPASSGTSAITGYNIYRGTTSGGETLLTSVGVVLTHTDTGLTNGVTYYYEVSALNGAGEGPKSNEASATPQAAPTVPTAPRNLAATAGNAQVVLTWQVPSSNGGAAITGYDVYRGTSSGGEALLQTLGNVLTFTDTSLTNGVTYYYEVTAVNSAGEGPKSNEAHATPAVPDTTPPSITITSPANNSAVTVAGLQVSGTASDNVAVAKVELSTDGTTWTTATGTTSWSGTVTLKSGTNTVYARATDSSGNTHTATLTVTLQTAVPGPYGIDPLLLGGIAAIVIVVAALVALLLVRRRRKKPETPPPPPP